jgi:hypothetical protein
LAKLIVFKLLVYNIYELVITKIVNGRPFLHLFAFGLVVLSQHHQSLFSLHQKLDAGRLAGGHVNTTQNYRFVPVSVAIENLGNAEP